MEMITFSRNNPVYAILLKMDKKTPTQFYMMEIHNHIQIEDQYNLYIKYPQTYSLEHWFNNKKECERMLQYLNYHLAEYSIMDYYKFRFNLTTEFVKNNKRMLQKLIYSLSIQKD